MAGNIFAGDSVQPLGARRQTKDTDPKAALDRIASKHQIPANAILAAMSAEKDRTPERAEAIAAEMAAQIKAGRGVEDVLRDRGGDDLLNMAYSIADQLEPAPAPVPKAPSAARDMGLGVAGAAARGVGGAIDYAGSTIDRALNSEDAQRVIGAATGRQAPLGPVATRLTDPAGAAVRGAGDDILDRVSPEARQAAQKTLPTGDPFDPATWKAPEDFSWQGLGQVAAEGLGSLLPVVATAIATRGSSLAAGAVGGAMAGGDGRDTAAQVIDDLWNRKGEDGTPELARQSDVFRTLTAQGMDPNAAYQETRRRAMNVAGDIQAVIGGAGGAFTGGLVAKGLPAGIAGKSLAGNIARGVAVGATEEGLQEGLESTGARVGVNIGAGTNLNPTEGAIEAAAAGALAGGPIGALVARRPPQAPPAPPPAPPMLALPAPTQGGTIFADGAPAPDGTPGASQPAAFRQQPASPGDGSAGGQATAPAVPPVTPAGMGVVADKLPPAGPIEEAARLAPNLTPLPEPAPPPQKFPDQKPGGTVRVYDDDAGIIRDVVFQRENPDGNVVIRIDGVEIDLDPVTFDTARRQAADMDRAAEAAAKKDGKAPAAAPIPEVTPPVAQPTLPAPETAPAKPGDEALSQKALNAVKPPKEKKPQAPITPEEAARQMQQMEDRAREGGWTAPMKRKHEALRKIVDAAPKFDPQTGELASEQDGDERAPSVADAGIVGAGATRGGDADTGMAEQPGPADDTARQPVGAGSEVNRPIAGVVAKPDAALTPQRAPVEPIRTPPEQRMQPDMLGGEAVSEADMAAKERRRREWGRALGIASGRSSDDVTLEGRDVLIRPTKIVIRAKPGGKSDLDYTLDTEGMDRDTIADRLRGALQELDRVSPLPEASRPVAASAPHVGQRQATLPPADEPQRPVPTREQIEAAAAQTDPDPTPAPTIEDIREKAAILRGVPKDQPPVVDGVSLKWDDKDGGFIFSRKHTDKVRAAVMPKAPQNEGTPGVLVIKSLQTGKETVVDTRPSRPEAPKTDKQKLFDAFRAAIRTGNAPEFKRLRGIMVKAYGEPATASIEQDETDKMNAAKPSAPPAGPRVMVNLIGRDGLTDAERAAGKAPYDTPLPDAAPLEAVGMVKGKSTVEDAWFRKQAEQGGVATYKAKAVPGGWRLTRDFEPSGQTTMPPTRQFGTVGTTGDAIAQLRENGMRTGVPEEASPPATKATPRAADGWWNALTVDQRTTALGEAGFLGREWADLTSDERVQIYEETAASVQFQSRPATKPAPAKPASGILSVLSQDEQALAADLMAKLAAKARNQTSSGLDPEYITLGGQLVGLYIKAGTKRFAKMLKDFAAATGLTIREAQAPLRAAYNYVREEKDLAGEDVSDMDSADQVMAEVRKMIAAEQVKPAPKPDMLNGTGNTEDTANGAAVGNDRNAGDESSQPEAVSGNVGQGSGLASDQGNNGAGEGRLQSEGGVLRPNGRGLQDAGGTGGGTGASRSGGTRFDGETPRNYRIRQGGLNDSRGEKTRAKDSIEAIRLLKQIEAQGRRATPAEQDKLALYAGAGSLNPAVPNSDGRVRAGWEDLAADLAGLVSKDEMDTIARTTQYAFYTSEEIVRGIWSAVERLGFKGGNVFEPGMGIGHFLGMAPDSVADRMKYRGLELDSITARIARQLYPAATVHNRDYTQTAVPTGFYDLAIGNPPFANIEIKSDKKYPQKFLLHDYFFAKTLDAVRPGGLLAFVTSEGTMNKMDDDARRYLAERADLVGSIRLPNTAFKGSAGTEVTTDVIFLRKRAEGEPAGDLSWLNVDMVPLPGLEGGRMTEFKVNRYFVQNPDMILGKQGGFGTMRFRGQYAVVPNEGESLRDAFSAAIAKLPADVMTDPAYDPTKPQEAVDPESGQTKVGSFYVRDGELWQFDGSVGRKVKRRGAEGGAMIAADYRKAIQFVAIRDNLREVYKADLGGDAATADAARAKLNAAYDAFVAEHGPINKSKIQNRRPNGPAMERERVIQREEALEQGRRWSEGSFDPSPYIDATMMEQPDEDSDDPTGPVSGEAPKEGKRFTWTQIARMRKESRERLGDAYDDGSFDPNEVEDIEIVKRVNLNPIMDDPEVWRIAALEKYDPGTDTATKTKVFTESVMARQTEPEIRDAKDALNYVMAMRGYPDIAMIAEKAGVSEEAAILQLDGLIFRDPESGRWENRDIYLSGNVRKKLEAARAVGGPEMERNVTALESVLPRDLTEYEVTATPGMPWIPIDVMQDFSAEIGIKVKIDRATAGGRWVVAGDKDSTEARVTWGTQDYPFPDLLEKVLNRTVIKVQRTSRNADGSTTTTLDEEATQAANEKAEAIREKFVGWVWTDADRKERLLRIYNDRHNSTVAPTFDGSYLTTPGIAKGWQWRPHQLRAIARILQSGSTYLAHAVGAGKTSEMIAAAMEARRLGIARKPMFTVPNHMLGQFATEFYEHYPTANILVADERRFHGDRRKQFIADAAANDYDAIILTHSAFQKVAVSDAINDEFVQAEIERFDEAIRASRADGDRITTKEMERAKEKLEQRLRGNAGSGADAQLTFEELGVDMLFVDEAHLFRKLDFATQLGALKGITPSGSKMSWDLFLKTRHLERVNPGRGIVLASGTPITNTMAELFTISRYIQHDTLEELGLLDFDSWAQSYGETAIDYEPDAAGNYKAVSRFARFVNTRDLSLMVRQRMDTVIPEDLAKYVVRPKLKGGSRIAVPVPRSPAVEAYQGELAARMKAFEDRKGSPKKGDDNHLVVIGDGIAAATDMRLIDDRLSGRDSKLTKLAENVLRIWKETADAAFYKPDDDAKEFSKEVAFRGPAAQMVFADIQRRPGKSSFDTHVFIRDYLVSKGVPPEQIALFRDFKNTEAKRRLFRRVNDGEVRVLIGSAKAMGTGVNAQRRLIAMHNLDPHWYPALDEQRVGRILRQGNYNPEIEVYDYATEGTYDSTMWQMMGRKARTIEDFLRGDPNINEMEDVGPASVFEQLAGMTTPDPRILRLKELQETVKKLVRRRANIAGERRALQSNIEWAKGGVTQNRRMAEIWEAVADKHVDLRGDKFRVKVGDAEFTDRTEFGQALDATVKEWALRNEGWPNTQVGDVSGVPLMLRATNAADGVWAGFNVNTGDDKTMRVTLELVLGKNATRTFDLYENPVDTAKALTRAMNDVVEIGPFYRKKESEEAAKLERDTRALAKFEGFKDEGTLNQRRAELDALQAELDSEETARRKAKDAPPAPKAAPVEDTGMESRFPEGREPVATLTGNELGAWEDIRQLGKKAEAWYRKNLLGSSVVNKDSGMSITFTNAGAKKLSGRKGDVLYRSVPALRAILTDGSVSSVTPEAKGRKHIKAWHSISARVVLDGQPRDVVAHVMETADGNFHYDLSRDMSDGARFMRFGADTSITGDRYGLEDNPVDINLDFADPEINADAVPVGSLRDIAHMAQAEIASAGLAGKVTPRVVRGLLGAAGVPIQGRQRGAMIEVNPAAGDARGVMRHEIVHALRDPDLWGASHGLFRPEEWRALVKAARSDADLMDKVRVAYRDRSEAVQVEEAVAELYREWAAARDAAGTMSRIFNKVRGFLQAMASALRGEGFASPALVMERIAGGKIGGRGPDGPGGGQSINDGAEMRAALSRTGAKAKGMIGSAHWKDPGAFVSSILTDAMVGKGDGGAYSLLSLVPGRPLFMELGKKMVSARAYLRVKEEMDALRNAWHARADTIAQGWMELRNKDPRANDAMMDVMHRATLAGVDPSKPMPSDHVWLQRAREELSRRGDSAEAWAQGVLQAAAAKAQAHAELKRAYDTLPEPFRALYGKVLGEYTAIADDFDKAVMENIQNATRIGMKRAERAYLKEVRRIQDEGLTGEAKDEAMAEAQAKLDAVKKRGGFAAKARLNALRKVFEKNRMKGPYVPLARFGDYFVTVRNDAGEVTSFSRFEREVQQQTFIREMETQNPGRVQHGLISAKGTLRSQVDPTFVADVERLLAESGAEFEVMDAVWQRWLETLPDTSIRTSKIHRKGRAGYSQDAFRAFGKHMFHGSHQLARLKYGILLEDHMDEAALEARKSDNPNRMGAIVREMHRRHAFTMDPQVSAWAAGATNLAFIWYLGATPAAAIANLTQTTVVGVPLMATRFRKAGVAGVSAELAKAMRDFTKGRGANWRETWSATNTPGLPQDEVDALHEAYRRGTIDKTQAHDLAAVAETGVEYSALRERVMRKIGWMFHHAERLNREVTFLAGYRLAKADGLIGTAAIDAAADITWKVHFDYQSSSRPRAMQGDLARIVTTFRNFTVNMLWRLFRDTHQSLNGATAAERAEARSQLIGITLSMMAHAGIRGTWGYGILMLMLGMFFPGGGDDAEDWLQDALLMEGDSAGTAAWNYGMGMVLNGAPGKVLGLDLRERIGMPNLWFRGDDRDLEGQDLYFTHLQELLGPVAGIPLGFYRGLDYASDGDLWRGTEAAVPKMVRDLMKAGRFSYEGALTRNGDPIMEDVSPYQAIMQASGFTPAQLAERYQINNRLKNSEKRILDERSGLHRTAGDALRAGQPLPESVVNQIREFNSRYPEYPITSDTLRQSVMSRIRASDRNEFGVALNPKLNDRLRDERPTAVYN